MLERLKKIFAPKESSSPKGAMPGAAPAASPAGDAILINAYCTVGAVPEPAFAHGLVGRRDLSDPALATHLEGFMGYISQHGGTEMTRIKYHTLRHVQRVQQQLSISVSASLMDAFAVWAEEANAILFLPDGSVRDPQGRILLGDGGANAQAEIPYPRQAWQRKARTDAYLADLGLNVPAHLPPLVSEPELRLRLPAEIIGRATALFAVAVQAESWAVQQPMPLAELQQKLPTAFKHLTPKERFFLDQAAPSQEEITQFAWRYECLSVLQWLLGLADTLPLPAAICDVPLVARTALEMGGGERLKGAKLRPVEQILDALDLHYRLHWLTRQAQVSQQAVPAQLEAGVILERHYALNWLVGFEGRDWDDIDTPT